MEDNMKKNDKLKIVKYHNGPFIESNAYVCL